MLLGELHERKNPMACTPTREGRLCSTSLHSSPIIACASSALMLVYS
jgi:hypothetical protein